MTKTIIFFTVCSLLLSACDSATTGSSGATKTSASPVRITGHVFSDDGEITQAKIEAVDASGKLAAQAELNGNSGYTLTIPAETAYPLILTAHPPDAPEPHVKAAIANTKVSEQDISPITTAVAETALNLGGISEINLSKAAGAAIALRKKAGSGGGAATSENFKGDPTKQYGGWH